MKKYKLKKLLAVLLVITLVISQAGCTKKKKSDKKNNSSIVPGSSITPAPVTSVKDISTGDGSSPTLTGVLTYVDGREMKMHFVDINSGTEYEVSYSGGTDIQDAFSKVKAAAIMDLGEIYDVYCNKDGRAEKIYGSTKAWERNEVSGIELDEDSRKIQIGATSLVYESYSVVISGEDRLNIAKLVDQDVLTVRGIDDKVYSINVKKGHGYLQFSGVDLFIGGYVSIGSKLLYGVSDNMLVTAPEGTYEVNIKIADTSASKTVTVVKDSTTNVDFSEYREAVKKTGAVNFSITPTGAILSIDGQEVDYKTPVSLTYGVHSLKLVANNYEEYSESFVVNSPYVTKVIDMVSTGSGSGSTTASTKSSDLTAGFSVTVNAPEGAALYVDSMYIGIIPCSFNKTQGNKTITLSKSGYNTVSYTIAIPNAAGNLTYNFPDLEKKDTTQPPTVESPTVKEPSVDVPNANVPTVQAPTNSN